MRLTLFVLFSLHFCFSQIYAQTEQFSIKPIVQRSFDERDGLVLDQISSIKLDDFGWLWIGGLQYRLTQFKNENQKGVLYRFNGSIFQEIKLPTEYDKNYMSVALYKINESKILIVLQFSDDLIFYKLDVNTVVFEKIELPGSIPNDFPSAQVRFSADEMIVFISSKSECHLYTVNDSGDFHLLTAIPTFKAGFVSKVASYENLYIVGTDANGSVKINRLTGESENITWNEIEQNSKYRNQKVNLEALYEHANSYYFKFDISPNLYTYDEISDSWTLVEKYNAKMFTNSVKDQSGNYFTQTLTDQGIEISITKDNNSGSSRKVVLPGASYYSIESEDFTKSNYLANREDLYQIVYSGSDVMTFLPDFSIRSILPLELDKYLVGTEGNGLFVVNTTDGSATSYIVEVAGKSYSPNSNRNFFLSADTIWSNDVFGAIFINKTNRRTELFPFARLSCMTEDSHYIYGGTVQNHLVAFNKRLKTYQLLDKTDTLDFSDIKIKDGIIYGATNKGFYIFDGDQGQLIKPSSNIKDNYLLFITLHPTDGLLIGSQTGELYSYDIKEGEFEVIYEDKLHASIAGVLFDDHDNIWINTFAGFVKYNPVSKSEVRYDESEGFSHFESNRHSALKTADGHFFIGTLNGLNYFHPDSIELFENKADFHLVSLQYFDSDTRKQRKIISKNLLADSKLIVLPPENRNLTIEFAVFGNETAQKMTYRYTLDGKNWSAITGKNQMNIINLAPGNYDLRIEALTFDQEKIGNPIELKILSKDFFYNRRWFIVLVILFITTAATGIIYNYQRQQKLQEEFSQNIIEATEYQKANIARELHDSVGQKLVLLSQNADQNKNPESKKLIASTLSELRNISKGLHPSIMERLGPTAAMHSLINEIDEKSDIFIDAKIDNIDGLLSDSKSLHIYRIIQESLGNVLKHAEAQAATIKISADNKVIHVEISDNGKGFVFQEKTVSGIGMRTLVERAKILSAKIDISGNVGEGTHIRLLVPILSA